MRQVVTTPEVEAIVGAEQLDRYRADPAMADLDCVVCRQPIRPDGPAAILVYRSADRMLTHVVNAHPTCASSRVVENAALRLPSALGMRATPALLPTATGERAALVLDVVGEAAHVTEATGDLVDIVTTGMLARGWAQVTRLGRTPPRTTTAVAWVTGTGWPSQLLITAVAVDGTTDTLYDGEVYEPDRWRLHVASEAAVAVYVGSSLRLVDHPGSELAILTHAARRGRLTGAVVPAVVRA